MSGRVEATGEPSPGASPPAQENATEQRKRTKIIFVVYVIVALDVTWMFLQFSVTPYLAKKLGLDTLWFGYLQTTVGVIQLLGGPIFGRFADVFGARAALSLSCSSTVVFFLLLAIAENPAMLFIHKLPTVFMHVLTASQMVVADLSAPEKRADALSKLGLCFGIGMITGSTLGGHLSTRYGETFTACFGAVGSAFSLLLVLKFIPKTTKSQASRTHKHSENKSKSIFNVGEITRLLKFPGVKRTFLVKIVAGLPTGIFQVMFSVITLDFFKLRPEQNGYLMAYFGVASMVVQGGVVGRLTARYSENSLLLLAIGVSSLVGLAQAYMQDVFQFCLIVFPMMFSLSLFNVITDTMLTKSVPSSDTGTMMGLCASVQSLLRTVGPTVGGFLYVNYGISSIGLIQFVVNVGVFGLLLQRHLTRTAEHQE
ncbi:solute carrier family 22 member 18 isoform X1 [Pseudoliparis swirei]|uniref:solute carrier family 22 member 18 isoform X1 n=1 Tax=Pseudoliparis swirei TaxID=2059687 RepID=UPI0024BE8A8D|nr:solute carrier family 22 member 18 isoform X1 [Pseudoliparis swirei]XP_056268131.1 solute carrier family 22 member 18 isoform X1 [Pseudoliparis swirei]XP_056268132.1 solute carrier family 22 member 18 isoform X1 [Pseudoliparis swirei]